MISHLSHTSVFVLDQDSAKAFYTEKLGFEVRYDITMGEEFEGAGRRLPLADRGSQGPTRPAAGLVLVRHGSFTGSRRAAARPGSGRRLGVGVLATDDCRRTYNELKAKGVTFLAEPTERPYGIEATMRDDSGNLHQPDPTPRVRSRGHVEPLSAAGATAAPAPTTASHCPGRTSGHGRVRGGRGLDTAGTFI